jgi:hypothetical protein
VLNGFVHIIESPSANDLLADRTEGKALSEALRLAQIPYSYNLVTNRLTLEQALGTRLIEEYSRLQKSPIIHFSTHGNEHGVALTDETFVSWHDLRELLKPVFRAMNGGLLVCLSSCAGGSGCRMAMYDDAEPPFWALVGHPGNADWADAAVGYITFYHRFFRGATVEESVQAMKAASGDSAFLVFAGVHIKEGWKAFQQQQFLQQQQRLTNLINALGIQTANAPAAGSLSPQSGANSMSPMLPASAASERAQ